MKSLLLNFLVLFASQCLAQKQLVLADSITKEVIPFALIHFDNGQGLYSNENGVFTFNEDSVNQLEITFLGYEQLKIATADIHADTLLMQAQILQLKEVVVRSKAKLYSTDFLKIDRKARSIAVMAHLELVTKVSPKHDGLIGRLQEVRFSFAKKRISDKDNQIKNARAIVRVNIYTNDATLNKIYSSSPINLEAYKKDQIAVDLSQELIHLEEGGLAFGLEYIGHINEYGELIADAKPVQAHITTDQTADFVQDTFVRSVFNHKEIIIPSLDIFIRETAPPPVNESKFKRNLAIAFTVRPYK